MITDIEGMIAKITDEIKDRVDIAVIGLSGGVDSLVVAILCKLALGGGNVSSVHMPYGEIDFTPGKFNDNSKKIANKLGIRIIDSPIGKIVDALNETVEASVGISLNTLNLGNSRSRARMCVLYSIAHEIGFLLEKRVRVMGTGNYSEDFIGYDTKGGDALGDLFPMGELFKSEVYQLADYFVEKGLIDEDMIDQKPSAGLWDGQTDEDELGYSYNTMEHALRGLEYKTIAFGDGGGINMDLSGFSKVQKFVINRHITNKHKHEAPPSLRIREFCDGYKIIT